MGLVFVSDNRGLHKCVFYLYCVFATSAIMNYLQICNIGSIAFVCGRLKVARAAALNLYFYIKWCATSSHALEQWQEFFLAPRAFAHHYVVHSIRTTVSLRNILIPGRDLSSLMQRRIAYTPRPYTSTTRITRIRYTRSGTSMRCFQNDKISKTQTFGRPKKVKCLKEMKITLPKLNWGIFWIRADYHSPQ